MRRTLIAAFVALMMPATAAAQAMITPEVTKTDIAVIQAQIPTPATSIPSPDMTTTGVADPSLVFRPIGAQAPRISRTVKQVVTGSNGTAPVSWVAMPSVPGLTITEYVSSTDTMTPACFPVTGTVTTTGATIKCFVDQSIAGLGLAPRKVAGAGVTFDVLALP